MAQATQGGGRIGALGALVTLLLTLLLAAGQAPYDWAWSRGQHATPAQWRAHERYGAERGGGHHGAPAAGQAATTGSAESVESPSHGTWLEDGAHEAHRAPVDGYVADRSRRMTLVVPAPWRPVAPPALMVRSSAPAKPPTEPPQRANAR